MAVGGAASAAAKARAFLIFSRLQKSSSSQEQPRVTLQIYTLIRPVPGLQHQLQKRLQSGNVATKQIKRPLNMLESVSSHCHRRRYDTFQGAREETSSPKP